MGLMVCEFCGELDERENLVTPCDCHKKLEDGGRVHLDCLGAHLKDLAAEGGGKADQKCPRCKQTYSVAFRQRFVCDCDHVCNMETIGNAFELVLILFTVACTGFSLTLLDFNNEKEGGKWLIGWMSVMTLVLVILTIRKVYGRFRTSASDTEISEV